MVVLSNVVVELGPEACGELPCRSAAARPEGRAGSEGMNDLSLADRIDNARPTAEDKEVISAARGLEMALASASEADSVLVNPIASVTVLGTHVGRGTGEDIQSNLIELRSQSPCWQKWSCSCSRKSKMELSLLPGSCPAVSPW